MKKLILLLITALTAHAANYDLRYLQENASGKIVERTVTLTPSTFLSVTANGTLQVQSSSSFKSALAIAAGDLTADLTTNNSGSGHLFLYDNATLAGPWLTANASTFRSVLGLGTLATQSGTYGNATELTTGTVPAARLPGLTLNLSGTLHNTPVTFTAGVGNATLANQTANTIFAGPSSGNATTPTFRALTNADIPSSLSLSGNLTTNSTFTAGDAASDDFVANDDDPRFPNLTSATYTAAADNKVAINGDVGDSRYGNIYFARVASNENFTGTTMSNSTVSFTLPAGTYHINAVLHFTTNSTTAGINGQFRLTSAADSAITSTMDNNANFAASVVRNAIGSGPTNIIGVATDQNISGQLRFYTTSGVFVLAAERTIVLEASQRTTTDGSNPVILKAGSWILIRKIL